MNIKQINGDPVCPPIGQFPPQCPGIFPGISCTCSITGTSSGNFASSPIPILGTSVTAISILFTICPNCGLSGSSINGSITLANGIMVTVVSDVIEPPTCAGTAASTTGSLSLSGTIVPFTLTVSTSTLPNTAILNISGIILPMTGSISIVSC